MQLHAVRRGKTRSKCQEGFTIVEVLLAMAIFLIGILAVLMMHIKAINTNSGARGVTINYTWAMDKVEELLRLPYTDANLVAGVHTPASDADSIDNDCDGRIDEEGEAGQILISWTVQDNFPVTETKSVRVTITQRVPLVGDKVLNVDFIKADIL